MKIISVLFFLMPIMTFACPVLTGKYTCTSPSSAWDWRIDSMTFTKTAQGLDIVLQRYGWHIVGGDDQPFSGKPVTGPYTDTMSLNEGQIVTQDGNGTITDTTSCDSNGIHEHVVDTEDGTTADSILTVGDNNQFTYQEASTRGTDNYDFGTFACSRAQ